VRNGDAVLRGYGVCHALDKRKCPAMKNRPCLTADDARAIGAAAAAEAVANGWAVAIAVVDDGNHL